MPVTRKLDEVITSIMAVSQDEIDCDKCFDQLDRFAELYASGEDPAAILPRIEQHLITCGDCQELYDALLSVLRSDIAGQT